VSRGREKYDSGNDESLKGLGRRIPIHLDVCNGGKKRHSYLWNMKCAVDKAFRLFYPRGRTLDLCL
jgi:hypothetical protein